MRETACYIQDSLPGPSRQLLLFSSGPAAAAGSVSIASSSPAWLKTQSAALSTLLPCAPSAQYHRDIHVVCIVVPCTACVSVCVCVCVCACVCVCECVCVCVCECVCVCVSTAHSGFERLHCLFPGETQCHHHGNSILAGFRGR